MMTSYKELYCYSNNKLTFDIEVCAVTYVGYPTGTYINLMDFKLIYQKM